ncbi:hypothetical protein EV294_101306 [Paenibacillus sp. BK033]|uniref:hypothetical protein n=1 Tax=Paenibacillus sp. BK033 TaxID=2512133 RepID=UPI00104F6D5E|nr:hypothetical protein [Paenibacillus sp. BK033]TCN00856.1 hypothetical protein EV294_101306 [Paenibacillus sp. BK033]
MPTVLKTFRCKVTKHLFEAGEEYEGKREAELAALGYIGAEAVVEQWPKHVGGGKYELSNGEVVKGKAAAEEAQADLDSLDD